MNNTPYAFPCEQHETQDGTWNQTFEPGMTLRNYFAAKAMQGYLMAPDTGWSFDEVVSASYRMADAMLKASEKTNG